MWPARGRDHTYVCPTPFLQSQTKEVRNDGVCDGIPGWDFLNEGEGGGSGGVQDHHHPGGAGGLQILEKGMGSLRGLLVTESVFTPLFPCGFGARDLTAPAGDPGTPAETIDKCPLHVRYMSVTCPLHVRYIVRYWQSP